MPHSQEVHSLIGHGDLEMSLLCLGSLMSRSQEPLRLVLHDDGSLTPGDEERLRTSLEPVVIVSRREADLRVADMLARHPQAMQFRRDDIFGLKLLDIALLGEGEIAYCDTDIHFFRPFTGLFQFPDAATSALFMADLQNAYSIAAHELWKAREARLPRQANAGLLFCRRRAYDLDFIEWFLCQPRFRLVPHWVEQTCWAMMGQRAGCRLWQPKQIWMADRRERPPAGMVAGHFVRPSRTMLLDLKERFATPAAEPPARIATVPSQSCGPVRLAISQLRNRWGRWRHTRQDRQQARSASGPGHE